MTSKRTGCSPELKKGPMPLLCSGRNIHLKTSLLLQICMIVVFFVDKDFCDYRGIARLSTLGGQERNISSVFHILLLFLPFSSFSSSLKSSGWASHLPRKALATPLQDRHLSYFGLDIEDLLPVIIVSWFVIGVDLKWNTSLQLVTCQVVILISHFQHLFKLNKENT